MSTTINGELGSSAEARSSIVPSSIAKGITMGLRAAMEAEPKVLIMGEDVGKLGGVFRVTDGLQKDFGEDRVIDTPLAESGILGTAIGLALRGYRPVCEIQFDGFIYPACDQIVTQLAKMGNRSKGQVKMPVVVRVPFGGGIGAVEHHSESPEAYFAHTAGLRVVSCSNPHDAYWMIQQAIASDDPVLFFEPKRRYWEKGDVDTAATPMPLHQARVVREGEHVTVAAYGPMVTTSIAAAKAAEEDGISLEVIDLRSLSPLDMDTLEASVLKTGRLVTVHEAPVFLGMGSELAARVTERCFYALEAPVLRVGGYHMPYPPSRLEEEYLPDLDRVLDAVDRSLAF
jgi:pyruvate dehydrogenase E1 component beta subunit